MRPRLYLVISYLSSPTRACAKPQAGVSPPQRSPPCIYIQQQATYTIKTILLSRSSSDAGQVETLEKLKASWLWLNHSELIVRCPKSPRQAEAWGKSLLLLTPTPQGKTPAPIEARAIPAGPYCMVVACAQASALTQRERLDDHLNVSIWTIIKRLKREKKKGRCMKLAYDVPRYLVR